MATQMPEGVGWPLARAKSALGFVRIAEEWKSLYWHPQKRAVLLVYVDDIKLAARREHLDELWKGLRSLIEMDEENEDARSLGCDHENFEARERDVESFFEGRSQNS